MLGKKYESECRGDTDNPKPTAEGASRAEHKELNEHTAKGGKSTSHKDVGLGVPRSADAGAKYPLQEARRRQSDWRRGTNLLVEDESINEHVEISDVMRT